MKYPHRRDIAKWLTLGGLGGGMPGFLAKTEAGLATSKKNPDRILVVIQLSGGNDGLNTLVPIEDPLYFKARPRLALDPKTTWKISDHAAFHPELVELRDLFREGRLAVIPGVGYPNPNRSHFRSTDIWESASSAERVLPTGWLGRWLQTLGKDQAELLGIRLGEQPCLALAGAARSTATFANPKMLDFPLKGTAAKAAEAIHGIEPTTLETLDFLQRTGASGRRLGAELEKATSHIRPKVDYPPFALCQSLRLVGQMIRAGFPTRVYHVTHGGFDTHAAQAQRQAYLLQELSQAISLFDKDLRLAGVSNRVLGFSYSEFGRRVAENKNGGTDHGAANVVFAFGDAVRPGILGPMPSLEQLDPLGDLKFRVDFRSLYGGILQDWFGAPSQPILQGDFPPFSLVKI